MSWKQINRSYKSRAETLSEKSPFEVLGVSASCSKEDLKKAYLEKVKLYHPDKNHPFMKKNGEDIMKILNNAYSRAKKALGYE